jgi:hypothetical protein
MAALNERILNHMYANEIENGESLNAAENSRIYVLFQISIGEKSTAVTYASE